MLNTYYIPLPKPVPKPVPEPERSEAEGCVSERIPAFPRNERSEEGLSSPNQPANRRDGPRNERSEEGLSPPNQPAKIRDAKYPNSSICHMMV